ncbi:hypothetical protein SAMN04488021_13913 [Paracoccus aminovorans]|uniref:Plasmid segregation centromere-binding protein ParG n=1 Tax=Paracoccus aminovorans TaxID=34004 RepID=A0A1I3DJ79_9RHOB|nr:hypothetical protein [Paracoccus aminovorans]PKP72092.1 MAG: hypothetical protein CVT83_01670 [Alphaproteobacteria bacterium HGW-Alphaproteobacteria-5]SFH86588.1 hypothetical protein SAMN04488021_13913 [Paracoccus aminovorans]
MTKPPQKRGFAARPTNPDDWIKAANQPPPVSSSDVGFTARLTIDVTPSLRGRIKIAAFQRGVTVADMLRELLAREFPQPPGDLS